MLPCGILICQFDELKKAGVFNELKAKQLRSRADIRNAVSHERMAEIQSARRRNDADRGQLLPYGNALIRIHNRKTG